MASKSFREKFRKSTGILQDAVERTIELDYNQPKLYKKVVKYYLEEGVQFTGEASEDYQILLDCIAQDLVAETV
jgi:hypothetical protein